ncbi:ArnT family glycosyltransferase [Pontibacter mangrovi]|uniref:Phospholipid carrier-dependent glycosyltransferase n=1 Tax=Pontibacter mangrovi TaxID=2589816 RepID=A0A501W4D1_9BACT|nr:phospholipid carrier-dependent glycosyltransferase [Pontibacter mangrovi]TPE43505.1 phospholipid carrier-dependent glycosyltransferase [Pontibacter mangrovi]
MLPSYNQRTGRSLLILLLVLFLLLIYKLGTWGVVETSEARYAEIGREMWHSGDLLHPRLLGIQHYHKPPLTYAITALGIQLFGPDAFGARFFLQISLLGQVWLVYLIGKQLLGNPRQALLAAVVYVTIPAVLVSARNLTTDSFLTTFELAAILGWLWYKARAQALWLYFFYLMLALAFLTKGPVGLIFPVLVLIGLGGNYTSSQNRTSGWHHLPGLLLFLALGGSWFLYLMRLDPQFIDYFLLRHTVQRFANPETFGRSKPWWFYLVLAPALSLPWSAILIANFRKLHQMPGPLKRLFILWILVPLVFFSFSGSKLILYILPIFAGQALLTAWLLHALSAEAARKAMTCGMLYFAVLAVVLFVAPLLPVGVALPWRVLTLPLGMLAALAILWTGERAPQQKLVYGALVFMALLLPYATNLMAHNPQLTNGSRPIAQAIQAKNLQERPILVYDRLLPSLAFELNRNIISLQDGSHKLERETQFERDEAWRAQLLQLGSPEGMEQLRQLLQQKPVLVVKRELPPERAWMLEHFTGQEKVGDWTIYY